MTIDYKTAKHICSVIRRQVQSSFPELYMEFVLHENEKRGEAFLKEKHLINELPAGNHMIEYIKSNESRNISEKNTSCFVAMARHKKPIFLGFFKSYDYLALSFINYSHFDNEIELKNHVFHIAWHAINLYKNHVNSDSKVNILTPEASKNQLYHNNLTADIFSTLVQLMQGRKDALDTMAKQRIYGTISPKIGFKAEEYSFPICLDTLEFMFDNNIDQYKNHKKPVIDAFNIAKNVSDAFDETAIKQWNSFSVPAQEMAWLGYSPNIILGAALYTSENTYIQSIADMIADKMGVKPETITSLQDYNPFANNKTNEHAHKKQCDDLIKSLLSKVKETGDYKILIEIARKQNQSLLEKSPMGWCANALIAVANIIEKDPDNKDILKDIFDKEVSAVAWDTLAHFFEIKFQHMRSGKNTDIIQIAQSNDEFISIYQALSLG